MSDKSLRINTVTIIIVVLLPVIISASSCDQRRGFSFGARYQDGGSYCGARPVLSPDGKFVVYSAATTSTPGGLFKISIEQDRATPITTTNFYQGQADISPDGKTLCYVSEQSGLPQLWLRTADGKEPRRLTKSEFAEDSPVFSNDGSMVAFVRRLTTSADDRISDEIFIVNNDGSNERRITNDKFEDSPIRFSTDNKAIYALSARSIQNGKTSDSDRMNLFKVALDDSSFSPVLPLNLRGPGCDISQDEQTIVYIDDPTTPFNFDLYSCKMDGSQKKRLTKSDSYMGSVRFGFHSNKVAFIEEPLRDGFGNMYLLDLQNASQKKVGSTLAP